MLRTRHMFGRAKSGMATVLGMIMFIGVLFTSVIPLFLYVNEVNSWYDSATKGMRYFDDDREREQIDVYAYPLSPPNDNLVNVFIKNRFSLSVKIVRVWVNDEKFEFSFEIPAMGSYTIESINVSTLLPTIPEETKGFNIKVTTDMGNIFSSHTNTLYYTEGNSWTGNTGLMIQIVIEDSTPGTHFYHVEVTNMTGTSEFSFQADLVMQPHETSSLAIVTVPFVGDYHITVKKGEAVLSPNPPDVSVDLYNPSVWVYVNAGT